MRSHKLVIILSVFTFAVSTLTPANANNPPRKILSGWLPDYSLARNLPTVEGNLDLIRDISPFWYGLTGETSIKDKYALGRYTTPKDAVIARLKANGLILLPTITDDTKKLVLANLLANPNSRTNIVQTIKNLVLKHNYDGIDLDFEVFYTQDGRSSWPTTKPNWIAFIKELSLPAIAAPMFLISGPQLVIECCKNGIVGTFPALNQRTSEGFEAWIIEIKAALLEHEKNTGNKPAPLE